MKGSVKAPFTFSRGRASVASSLPYRLLYDGDCGLCRRFVTWLAARDQQGRLQIAAYQDIPLPAQVRARARRSLQLIDPPGHREERGRAVLQTLALTGCTSINWLRLPPLIYLVDLGYCWVASHRELGSKWIQHREG